MGRFGGPFLLEQEMKLLAYADLKHVKGIGYSKVQIWRLEKVGEFPKRVPLGRARHAWLESEIDAWIGVRVRARQGDR
jgi:prophage regulatory protein